MVESPPLIIVIASQWLGGDLRSLTLKLVEWAVEVSECVLAWRPTTMGKTWNSPAKDLFRLGMTCRFFGVVSSGAGE